VYISGMKANKKIKRSKVINLRVTAREDSRWKRAAKLDSRTLSSWLRNLGNPAADAAIPKPVRRKPQTPTGPA